MLKKIIKKLSMYSNAMLYSLKFDIGKRSQFEKISLLAPKNKLKIGNNVVILRGTELCANQRGGIDIGDKTYINQGCIIRPNTTIGSNVAIGPRTLIMSDSHVIGPSERRSGPSNYPPIVVGDGCWIGAAVTILGGVTIGEGTIIGAGSLVNKDCEPNSLYAGNPARFIKKLD